MEKWKSGKVTKKCIELVRHFSAASLLLNSLSTSNLLFHVSTFPAAGRTLGFLYLLDQVARTRSRRSGERVGGRSQRSSASLAVGRGTFTTGEHRRRRRVLAAQSTRAPRQRVHPGSSAPLSGGLDVRIRQRQKMVQQYGGWEHQGAAEDKRRPGVLLSLTQPSHPMERCEKRVSSVPSPCCMRRQSRRSGSGSSSQRYWAACPFR